MVLKCPFVLRVPGICKCVPRRPFLSRLPLKPLRGILPQTLFFFARTTSNMPWNLQRISLAIAELFYKGRPNQRGEVQRMSIAPAGEFLQENGADGDLGSK